MSKDGLTALMRPAPPLPPPAALLAEEIRLDLEDGSLHRGGEDVPLRPKVLAVLRYLMEHPGRLIPRDELLRAVWPDTSVVPSVLKVCVRELRQALREDPAAPRFVQSVQRRGYRFIAQVTASAAAPSGSALIGRGAELGRLQEAMARALRGERQVVFVTGEAGLGKTTFVEAFLATLPPQVLAEIGQCMEHRGAKEAYLPMLEALGGLCRRPGGERVRALLHRHAPTWLLHLPACSDPEDDDALRRETIGATPERMLRELAELLEAITADTPLALVMDDLHFGDASTLDLLSYLARRRPPARLLLVGLYRPEDAPRGDLGVDALLRDLLSQRRCLELPLRCFGEAEVAACLSAHLSTVELPSGLTPSVLRRTGGNPLFVTTLADELAGCRGASPEQLLDLVERTVPDNVRLMLERRVERLGTEAQALLAAASVVGEAFCAALVASVLGEEPGRVEAACEHLAASRRFITRDGLAEWPDGTLSGAFRFRHALYQTVLYERTSPAQRILWHRRTALRLEAAWAERPGEMAPELAWHCEQGREPARAVRFLQAAARVSSRRLANREANAVLEQALSLLSQVAGPDRTRLHLDLRQQRAALYRSMGDLPAALGELTALAAAAAEAGDLRRQVQALLSTADVLAWFDTARCLEVLERAAALSRDLEDEGTRLQVRGHLGFIRATRRRWSDEDADACVAAAEAAQAEDEGAPAWSGRGAHILVHRTRNLAACALAKKGLERALREGDVADYLSLHMNWSGALFHLGELGQAIDVRLRGVETAEQNGHAMWAGVLRACIALAYEQACAFAEARDLAEATLAFAVEDAARRTTLLQMSRCVLGFAFRGLGEPERALRHLLDIPDKDCQDLAVASTRSYALSRCWLALGEPARAAQEAGRLLDLVEPPGERCLISLGRSVRALAAMALGRAEEAEVEIGRALGALAGEEPIVSTFRVLATAAEVHRYLEREAEARRHLLGSAAAVRRMAAGLSGHPKIQRALLTSAEVRAILGGEGELEPN